MIKVLGLSLYGSQAASHRVRLAQYRDGLERSEIRLEIQSLLDNNYLRQSFSGFRPSFESLLSAYWQRVGTLVRAGKFDIAIVYAELLPFVPGWVECCLLSRPFIYDLDDAFYLKYRSGRFRGLNFVLGSKCEYMIKRASAVTAGNTELAGFASRVNQRVTLLPSVVDTSHYLPAACKANSSFTVGWIGSPSTAPYLQELVEPLEDLAQEMPVRLLVIGGKAPKIAGVEVIESPWNLTHEVELIQQFDVGVMPLPDTDWTRGKCAYKLIQCMSCAIPVIASNVGSNVDVVPKSSGILVGSSGQWLDGFRVLANNPELRVCMGKCAREWVKRHYSLSVTTPLLASVIRKVYDEN
ncbi:MAG: glycosyltransferase [Synechococcus sp.]|nr:glycosyltransferase [Synechococcus sp.]